MGFYRVRVKSPVSQVLSSRFLMMTAKINVKGNGQECPFHTSKVKSNL